MSDRWNREDRPEMLSDRLGYDSSVGDEDWLRIKTRAPMTQPQIIREAADLAEHLYAGRTAQGLSQLRFAERHGFGNQAQIGDWERGRFEPTLSSAIRIAAALGYDLALVPREERA